MRAKGPRIDFSQVWIGRRIRDEEMAGARIVIISAARVATGCSRPSSDNIVYLRAKFDGHQSSCANRLSFVRIAGDGTIAGPKDAQGNFTIPSGQSLIVTDIHAAFTNSSAIVAQQRISLYLQGISGEVQVWAAAATAAPQSLGTYDRALTTGIRVSAPTLLCTAISDFEHLPEIVVTGYLQ